MKQNMLLCTDAYKLSHMSMYPDNTNSIFSYMEARKPDIPVVWFGFEYYFKQLAQFKITFDHIDEALTLYEHILGSVPDNVLKRYHQLRAIEHIPLQFNCPKEGTLTKSKLPLLGMATPTHFPKTSKICVSASSNTSLITKTTC